MDKFVNSVLFGLIGIFVLFFAGCVAPPENICDSSASVVYVGQNISYGSYTIKLIDLTVPSGSADPQAIFEVYDANNQLINQGLISAYTTKTIQLSDGKSISITACEINPELTTSKWVKLAVH